MSNNNNNNVEYLYKEIIDRCNQNPRHMKTFREQEKQVYLHQIDKKNQQTDKYQQQQQNNNPKKEKKQQQQDDINQIQEILITQQQQQQYYQTPHKPKIRSSNHIGSQNSINTSNINEIQKTITNKSEVKSLNPLNEDQLQKNDQLKFVPFVQERNSTGKLLSQVESNGNLGNKNSQVIAHKMSIRKRCYSSQENMKRNYYKMLIQQGKSEIQNVKNRLSGYKYEGFNFNPNDQSQQQKGLQSFQNTAFRQNTNSTRNLAKKNNQEVCLLSNLARQHNDRIQTEGNDQFLQYDDVDIDDDDDGQLVDNKNIKTEHFDDEENINNYQQPTAKMWSDFVVKRRVDEVDFNFLQTINKLNVMVLQDQIEKDKEFYVNNNYISDPNQYNSFLKIQGCNRISKPRVLRRTKCQSAYSNPPIGHYNPQLANKQNHQKGYISTLKTNREPIQKETEIDLDQKNINESSLKQISSTPYKSKSFDVLKKAQEIQKQKKRIENQEIDFNPSRDLRISKQRVNKVIKEDLRLFTNVSNYSANLVKDFQGNYFDTFKTDLNKMKKQFRHVRQEIGQIPVQSRRNYRILQEEQDKETEQMRKEWEKTQATYLNKKLFEKGETFSFLSGLKNIYQ